MGFSYVPALSGAARAALVESGNLSACASNKEEWRFLRTRSTGLYKHCSNSRPLPFGLLVLEGTRATDVH